MFYLKCGLWKENDIYVQYKFVDIQYPPPALFNILLSCLFNILLSSSSISSPRPSSSSISSSHPLQNPFLIIFNSFPIPRPSYSSISSSHTLQYPPLILFNILLSYTLQYPPLILINILLSPLQYPPILLFIILFSSSFIYLLIIYMKKKIVDFVCKFFFTSSLIHEYFPRYTIFFLSMYRVSQKTWEFSDEFDIVFVMN